MSYSDSERLIFGPYFNGASEVFGDPMRIYRRLVHGLDGDPNQVFANLKSESDPLRFEATEKLVAAGVFAFELMQFDTASGEGVMDGDCLKLVREFLTWIEQKKKTPEKTPTSPQPTATAS